MRAGRSLWCLGNMAGDQRWLIHFTPDEWQGRLYLPTMKAFPHIALALCFTACTAVSSNQLQVGKREAARLMDSYEHWLEEKPRKLDLMNVSATDLSNEARDVGFREGFVSSRTVVLSTSEDEGLVFGKVSKDGHVALKNSGFTLQPTPQDGVLSYRVQRAADSSVNKP